MIEQNKRHEHKKTSMTLKCASKDSKKLVTYKTHDKGIILALTIYLKEASDAGHGHPATAVV
jgi:hypothetical protein